MSETYVVSLAPQHRAEAIRSLVGAFDSDPLFNWMWPDSPYRTRVMTSLLSAQVDIAEEMATGYVALVEDKVVGAALWTPPGRRRNFRQTLQEIRSALPILSRPKTAYIGGSLLLKSEAKRPKEPHWALEILGVHPDGQGFGAGGSLIRAGLDNVDLHGLPSALETAKRENLAWYHRFGFKQTAEVIVGSAPPVWTMRRDSL